MTNHLAILQVVLPLIAAPLCSLINQAKACWLFATTISWLGVCYLIVFIYRGADRRQYSL